MPVGRYRVNLASASFFSPSQIKFEEQGTAYRVRCVRLNCPEAKGTVQADGRSHRRHRVQPHPLVTDATGLLDDGLDQLSAKSVAPERRPHIQPLHFADVSFERTKCHASSHFSIDRCDE